MIYFDTAASYPLLPEVKTSLFEAFELHYANASSNHYLGETVNSEVNKVRNILANKINAYPSEIIFTSGATESNNIAFKSLLLGGDILKDKKHIITSQIEHKCIHSICTYFVSMGYQISYVKPNEFGIISAESVRDAIREDTVLVSIMHVNNELGTINPISEIGQICRDNNIIFHSDAAQSFQKIHIDVEEQNVDTMSFSAHKIGGPKGIGAIYIRDLRKRKLMPLIHGAGQEEGIRGGSIAAPLVIGFGSAIENFSDHYKSFKEIRAKDFLIDKLCENKIEFKINGIDSSVPSCLSLTLPFTNVALLIRENEKKFSISQGSACSSKEITASHVLIAIGLTKDQAEKTIRLSFPLNVSYDNILKFVNKIKEFNKN